MLWESMMLCIPLMAINYTLIFTLMLIIHIYCMQAVRGMNDAYDAMESMFNHLNDFLISRH
jgi:hypothetical protein